MKDTLQRYVDLWPVLLAIVEENCESIQSMVYQHVTDFALKRFVEEYLQELSPIAKILDKLQCGRATLSFTVNVWNKLYQSLNQILPTDKQSILSK